MLKKLLYAGMLAACCSLAHADTPALSKYEFSWTGFQPYPDPNFYPDLTVHGTFAGVDANHNHVIELGELTELSIRGTEFVGCHYNTGDNSCGVSMFSFSQQGGLQLHAQQTIYYSPPGPDDWSASSETYHLGTPGDANYMEYSSFGRMYNESWGWAFTPQTVITVTAVPEPQSWLMLGAGLLLLSQAARRRKRA